MVNLGNPDLAFKTAFLPSDGVGLARMEFIISEYDQGRTRWHSSTRSEVDGPRHAAAIARLTQGYPDGASFFVERLAEGVGTIAAAF